jgi:hypothetical protein
VNFSQYPNIKCHGQFYPSSIVVVHKTCTTKKVIEKTHLRKWKRKKFTVVSRGYVSKYNLLESNGLFEKGKKEKKKKKEKKDTSQPASQEG